MPEPSVHVNQKSSKSMAGKFLCSNRSSSQMVLSYLNKLNDQARSESLFSDTFSKTKWVRGDIGVVKGDDSHDKVRETSKVYGENSSQTFSETY